MSESDWWKRGVIYQIYPRSFADSNGDGIGDLSGIIGRLDYLADFNRLVSEARRRGGGPPNNWQASFGGGAWEWDGRTGQYYLHSFMREQPDVNWRVLFSTHRETGESQSGSGFSRGAYEATIWEGR